MTNMKICNFFHKNKKIIIIVLVVILIISISLELNMNKTKDTNNIFIIKDKSNKKVNNNIDDKSDKEKNNNIDNKNNNIDNNNSKKEYKVWTLDDYFTDNVRKMDSYEEIKELFKKVNIFSGLDSNLYYSSYGFRIKDIYKTKSNINYDVFKKYGYDMAFGLLSFDKNKTYGDRRRKKQVSLDELNSTLKYIFGEEYINNYDEQYDFANYCYEYDSIQKVYNNVEDCDFPSAFSINLDVIIQVYDVTKDSNNINLYISVLYENTDNNTYYKNEYGLDNGRSEFKDEIKECQLNLKQSSCYKGGNLYKFVYTKENNNYIFSNIEQVN